MLSIQLTAPQTGRPDPSRRTSRRRRLDQERHRGAFGSEEWGGIDGVDLWGGMVRQAEQLVVLLCLFFSPSAGAIQSIH